jgi:hypothetical protein
MVNPCGVIYFDGYCSRSGEDGCEVDQILDGNLDRGRGNGKFHMPSDISGVQNSRKDWMTIITDLQICFKHTALTIKF